MDTLTDCILDLTGCQVEVYHPLIPGLVRIEWVCRYHLNVLGLQKCQQKLWDDWQERSHKRVFGYLVVAFHTVVFVSKLS